MDNGAWIREPRGLTLSRNPQVAQAREGKAASPRREEPRSRVCEGGRCRPGVGSDGSSGPKVPDGPTP